MSSSFSRTDDQSIRERIHSAHRITVLTGAGVSTESGIPDFKSTDESWEFEEPREVMLSAPFWRKYPARFWEVYRATLGRSTDSRFLEPGSFHRWLVELEQRPRTTNLTILTQNVDGLHSKAGSRNVIEAHGSSSRAICLECKRTVPMESIADDPLPKCANCDYFPVLKPDISLFFEGVHGIRDFRKLIDYSDLLIVAGTRLDVGPVNQLPYYAQFQRGIDSLWISNEESPEEYGFSHRWHGDLKEFTERFSLDSIASSSK